MPSTKDQHKGKHDDASPSVPPSDTFAQVSARKFRNPTNRRHRGPSSAGDGPRRRTKGSGPPSDQTPTTKTNEICFLWLVDLVVCPLRIAWWLVRTLRQYFPPLWVVDILLAVLVFIGVMEIIFDRLFHAPGLGVIMSGASRLFQFIITGGGGRNPPVVRFPDVVKWPQNTELALYKQSGDIDGSLRHLNSSAHGIADSIVQQCFESHMLLTECDGGLDAGSDATTPSSISINAYLDDTRSVVGPISVADSRYPNCPAAGKEHPFRTDKPARQRVIAGRVLSPHKASPSLI
ncbi:hypothetical protein CSUB01_11384 [Colletotrichum sublineola]|uniref:Uncharacterized protein n=1 Tax=Colletotrichum sublineola TaxID=1173701 RepID=A0A066X6V7_COLSU|nr:hypothetical protein CSUB01_11384 [Colletotrichum sublineola]